MKRVQITKHKDVIMKIGATDLNNYSRKAFDRLMMQRGVQRILYYFGNDLQMKKWVFIVGCYNSGTTLITNILRQHPLIGGLHTEGAYLTDALPYPERFGFPRMWSQCLEKVKIDPETNGEERAARIKRHWSLWYREGKPILAEKSVSNAVRMPFLNEYFKPAYFIYIIRNGYAVSKGIQLKANLKRWNSPYKSTGYPIEICAEQWKTADEIVEKDGKRVENLIKIYYEDLVNDPVSAVSTITEFLKVSPMPEELLKNKFSVHGVISEIKNMNDKALGRLEDKDWAKIEKIAGDRLYRHGYFRIVG